MNPGSVPAGEPTWTRERCCTERKVDALRERYQAILRYLATGGSPRTSSPRWTARPTTASTSAQSTPSMRVSARS